MGRREDNYASRASSSRGVRVARTTTGISRRKGRYPVEEEDDDDGDLTMECTGQSCRSCTAGVIADCVAVCCCPCAVVNCFTLAFLKVPWMMGRKYCLGLREKKKKKKKKKLKLEEMDGISRKEWGEEGTPATETVVEEEELEDDDDDNEETDKYSARYEAEKVWLELYRVDHLGFGRVSFTGIQSLG